MFAFLALNASLNLHTLPQIKTVLSHIYTGSVEVEACSEVELLRLAQKFLLVDLVEHLGEQLSSGIAVENFADMALLSDSYECGSLKRVRDPALSVRIPIFYVTCLRPAPTSSTPTSKRLLPLRLGVS